MSKFSIRTRLIFILSLILLLAFITTNIINYQISKRSIHNTIVDSALPLVSNNIYSEIQRDLMRPVFVSSLMANDTFLKDWVLGGEEDLDKITRYLKTIKENYGFDTSFLISDHSTIYYYYKGILKKIGHDDPHDVWYYNFIRSGQKYDLDVDTDQASANKLTIFINHRLLDENGNLLGVTGVGLSMDLMGKLLASYKEQFGRNVYLVDPEGIIQVHTNMALVRNLSIYNQEGIKDIAGLILEAKSESASFEYDQEGRHILLLTRYIPEFNWYLFVEQNETVTLKDIKRNLITNLIIGLLATCLVIGVSILTVNHFQGALEIMATTDKLTGLYNRREFDRNIERALYLVDREKKPFSLIIFDIDRFKNINDRWGHLVGDKVIQQVADITKACTRQNDVLCRWGGDEFIILTYSDLGGAITIGERIRTSVLNAEFRVEDGPAGENQIPVTASGGITQHQPGDTEETILARADSILYRAKEEGRNRVIGE